MTIVPAIDLRGGKCVRLLHGDPARETRYDDDPAERARRFVEAGATRLHVVDLDRAFGTGENLAAVRAVCAAVDVEIQTSGGVRTREDVESRLDAGADYVVVGTMLVETPELAAELVDEYKERLIAGIDARGLDVAVRGWQGSTTIERDDLAWHVAEIGFERIVFTEISRDGAGTGYDIAALAHVARLVPVKITASGGARTIDDLRALRDGVPPNVDSAIVGRALYEGTLDLASAIAELGDSPRVRRSAAEP
jgi:phosphoribosylformimino-5-aminoimidazole carboxamide ribotide isomerase